MAPLGAPVRGEAGRGLGRPDAIRPRRAVAGLVPRLLVPAPPSPPPTKKEAPTITTTPGTLPAPPPRRLAQTLRAPGVRTRASVRLSVQGAVPPPGYYGVPADALLSDALMAAGGTMQEANLPRLRIERNGKPIWEGKALQQAIAQGRTLDGAGLVAGDQVIVPRRSGATAGDVLRLVGVLVTIPVTIFTLTRLR